MAEEILSEMYFEEEEEPVCQSNDWQCMLQNVYVGYVLKVEAVVETGVDAEGNPVTEVYGVDVSGLSNEEIQQVIDNFKVIYPGAKEIRLHFCGNHIGKACKIMKV